MKQQSGWLNDSSIHERVHEAIANAPLGASGWTLHESNDRRFGWLEAHKKGEDNREQGWKLHISATINSAISVLDAVVPALITRGVSFKVCRSIDDLQFLNSGRAGFSQVGKFITVYPPDDEQLVRLAFELDELTRGLEGPAVPSDRPLGAGSLVHYRYGAFKELFYQEKSGRLVPALRSLTGELVPDVRSTIFRPPEWITDPFDEHGLLPPIEAITPLLFGRYLCFGTLHESVKGSIFLALDVDSADAPQCVIKQAHRAIHIDRSELDAQSLLRNEELILNLLAEDDFAPCVYNSFQTGGKTYLVLEHLEGINLRAYVAYRLYRGLLLDNAEVIYFARHLCAILEKLHERNIVHRDLKPANFIITEAQQLKLLDYELAYDLAGQGQGRSYAVIGTRGYTSPQQSAGDAPTVGDDIFGLGALLYFLATGCDPSLAPREWAFIERSIDHLNPVIDPSLQAIISKCTERDPNRRYASIGEVTKALDELEKASVPAAPQIAESGAQEAEVNSARLPAQLCRAIAVHIGEAVCAEAKALNPGIAWISTHDYSYGSVQRDINVGAAGIGLFLVDLFKYTGDTLFSEAAEETARWLMRFDYETQHFLPGLLVGECGVGLFLLRLARILDRAEYLDFSTAIADRVFRALPDSPDFFNGLAGCGIFFLCLAKATGRSVFLERAACIGDKLIELADTSGDACSWAVPDGYGEVSGNKYLGFAHGAAGIGYFLMELFAATGRETYRDCATEAAEYLVRQGEAVLRDGTGTNWPDTEGAEIRSLYWCHGAGGIGRFFLRAHQVCGSSRYLDYAIRAGKAVAEGGAWLNPTQCHGLAGNIEFLIDLYRVTGDFDWLARAEALASILRSHAIERDDVLIWPSEEPTVITPDYMIGYAGVGAAFLRLSSLPDDPGPYVFSSEWFD